MAKAVEKAHNTRRAPHMEKYTKITRQGNKYYLTLQVEHQSFQVNWSPEGLSKKEAEWHRDMLCIALDQLVSIESVMQLMKKVETG